MATADVKLDGKKRRQPLLLTSELKMPQRFTDTCAKMKSNSSRLKLRLFRT